MLNRFEPAVRMACYVLAAILLLQLSRQIVASDPLKGLRVPELPTLSDSNNAAAPTPAVSADKPGSTNISDKARQTNSPTLAQTNDLRLTNGLANATNGPQGQPRLANTAGLRPSIPGVTPVMQPRIERIVQSEILGQIIRPLPMALLGIAGEDAFLRAPNGQTGLVRTGGELGGIKLLRIGINRVLVEEAGQKKELTIFSGFGSESLLPKEGNP